MKKPSYASQVFDNENYKENCGGGCWTCLDDRIPAEGDHITCVVLDADGKIKNKRNVIFSEMSEDGTHGIVFDEATETIHSLARNAPWHPSPFPDGKFKSMCQAMISSIGPAAHSKGWLHVETEESAT